MPSVPTFLAGEILTAGKLQSLFEGWAPYTPQLTSTLTNPTLGSGAVQNGTYLVQGDLVHWRAFIQFGTSGVGAGTGTYQVSLPLPAATSDRLDLPFSGQCELNDSATGYRGVLRLATGLNDRVFMQLAGTGTATNVGAVSAPFTWGASDWMLLSGWYQAAES
jgi:hypothetical protein